MLKKELLNIFNVILPKEINNKFSGGRIPLYAFYLITLITIWRSLHHLFSSDGGAQSIATIPLNTFSLDAQMAVIGSFSLWGLSQLIIAIIYLLVLVKYKALIPLMYVLLIFEYFMRAFYIGNFKPIPLDGTAPGGVLNIPIMIFATIMLLLIFFKNRRAA